MTLDSCATLLLARGEPEEAERARQEAVTIARRLFGAENFSVAMTTAKLARIVQQRRQLPRALALHREGTGTMARLLSEGDLNLISARAGLASLPDGTVRRP